MNQRARHARRILRDHRRTPYRRSHIRWVNGPYQPGYTRWACPHCLGSVRVVSGQWRLRVLLNNAFDSARGDDSFAVLRRASLAAIADKLGLEVPEEQRVFDASEGLEKLRRD